MKNDVWLFSDLDGTLLPSDKQIPDDLRDSIQQFVQVTLRLQRGEPLNLLEPTGNSFP